MTTVAVSVPDSVLQALQARDVDVERDIRLAAAVDWYAKGLLSQGRAAELVGLSRWEFMQELGRRGVPTTNITADDLRDELTSLGEP
jgi:predicted HTH domain antitoxin